MHVYTFVFTPLVVVNADRMCHARIYVCVHSFGSC